MGLAHSPRIITDRLAFLLDASNSKSYESGSYWYDFMEKVSPNSSSGYGSLVSGAIHNSNGYWTFDGTNDSVLLLAEFNDLLPEHSDFTMSFWVNFDTLSQGGYLIKANTTTSFNLMFAPTYSAGTPSNSGGSDIGGATSNVLGIQMQEGAPNYTLFYVTTTSDPISANTWHNIVVVVNPSNNVFRIYVDGVEKGRFNSSTCDGVRSLSSTTFLSGGTSPYFDGKMATFSLHQKALSTSEIQQNYNALKGRYGI